MGESEKPSNIGGRIIKAGAIVVLAHICFKFISPLQYIFIGHMCDDATRDLFTFAFEGVLGLFFFIGEESLGPAFLPIFMQEKETSGEKHAWHFANTILTLQFLLISLAVIFVALFPVEFVRTFTDWEENGKNSELFTMAPLCARYIIFGLFGLSLGSTTYMLLNGYKRFFLAAFGDALFKLGVVIALAAAWILNLDMTGKTSIAVFAIGAFAGSFFKLGSHLFGLRDKVRLIRPSFNFKSPEMKRLYLLILPLLAGILVAKVRDYYNNIYVMTSLEKGVLSAKAFGQKIYQTISFVGPYAVSIAMLPFFCEMARKKDKTNLGIAINKSTRLTLFLCVPIAVLIICLSMPIAQILFQSGEFSYESTRQAAVANACYTLVLPFASLECIFMQAFFANKKTISITVIGIIFSTLSIIISFVGIQIYNLSGLHAVALVSLSYTLSRILKTITLGILMKRFIPCFSSKETLSFVLRLTICALFTALAAYGVRHTYEQFITVPEESNRLLVLIRVGPGLVLGGLTGALAAFITSFLFCKEEFHMIRDWAMEKLTPILKRIRKK